MKASESISHAQPSDLFDERISVVALIYYAAHSEHTDALTYIDTPAHETLAWLHRLQEEFYELRRENQSLRAENETLKRSEGAR